MKTILALTSAVMCAVLVSCATEPEVKSPSYYPLETGNWWRYVDIRDSHLVTTHQVGGKRILNGVTYTELRGTRTMCPRCDKPANFTTYMRVDDAGRVYELADADDDEILLIDPSRAASFPPSDDIPTNDCGYHTEAVPAGTFDDCLTISTPHYTSHGYAETFAPNVGLIKMDWIDSYNALVEAYVDGVHYPQ